MRSGPLWALRSANMTINAHISRHAWVGWLFIYLVELIFFSTYRLSNLSDLVKTSKTPNDDTTPTRIYGVLLGIVQDFVVISFLIVVLSVFDAAINHSCCNDTAPNGCTDCFTPGIPFWSRTQLVFKRVLRLSVIYAVCLLSVSVFALDVVTIRSYHRRYELNWSSDSEEFVVTKKQETRTATNVLVVVLATQGVVAIVTTVWFDLARWTPLGFAAQWKGMKSRDQGQPTVNISRRPVNYLVMDSDDFFDSDENEDLSSFFDSNNRMIRGTQRPQSPAILSEDRRHLGPSNCSEHSAQLQSQ
ncbi:hypothetical protein PC116_g26111 [Phytophthora cactorum]|uniref:Uncharacterized protein n=2 Tax=Phytophthora cactorum TaxID=29920 RepID=A0A8T1BE57_9STRA|nr:hypothetical protein PC111_g21492 [Phytophthora cactorum]KAG2798067.1 hypothetical protein PC112_g21517 [Phytophthora cactorum]KAG2841747.1 hypothetical protein PC113_g18971 [Phytophthora cactorum]KAG2879120.1 hypothetical protein PC114_g22739 [Phytophthora cactorum]KAG2898340.1 hypothetical protein PC117_g22570 [Phytophthora cactorum]